MTRRAPEVDPGRPDYHHLAPDGVYVLVLDPAEGARAEPGAHDERVDGLGGRLAEAEEVRAALDDLRDVLHAAADDGASSGDEAREKVGEVRRGVDGYGGERRADECAWDEGGFRDFLELW